MADLCALRCTGDQHCRARRRRCAHPVAYSHDALPVLHEPGRVWRPLREVRPHPCWRTVRDGALAIERRLGYASPSASRLAITPGRPAALRSRPSAGLPRSISRKGGRPRGAFSPYRFGRRPTDESTPPRRDREPSEERQDRHEEIECRGSGGDGDRGRPGSVRLDAGCVRNSDDDYWDPDGIQDLAQRRVRASRQGDLQRHQRWDHRP